MKLQNLLFTFFFIVGALYSPVNLQAAPYYEGKMITIVVGHSPGGGNDRLCRILAKHLPKYIPGKPAVIIQNMPGGATILAANHLYNVAKPDGLTIGTINRGLPITQLLEKEGVKFDLRKYSWIASMGVDSYVLTLRMDLPYKTVDDLKKAKGPIYIATMGVDSGDNQFCVLLKEFLKINLKMVYYNSSADCMLATERKEVDGRAGAYSSLKPFIERGLVRPFIRGRVLEPGIESLPVDEDLTSDKDGKIIMAIRSVQDNIGRPFVAPPGTPDNILNVLRGAFAKIAKSPEAQEDFRKLMMTGEHTPADKCLNAVNYVLNQPKDIIEKCKKYLK